MITADLLPGDVLLYPIGSNLAFQALGWAQRVAGIRDPMHAHVGLITRVGPRGTWADEASAYTDPGLVLIGVKYPWPCSVARFEDLDVNKAVAHVKRFEKQPYGFSALLWMGLYRRAGLRRLPVPRWTGWERVCSTLIAGALRAGGIDPFPDLHPSLILPADFSRLVVRGTWHPEGDKS